MAERVCLPQLGLTMEGGTLVRWIRAEGDRVARGDVLFELETDKAVVEVEAEADGFLRGIRLPEGEYAASGTLVAWIAGSADEALPDDAGGDGAGNAGTAEASAAENGAQAPAVTAAGTPAGHAGPDDGAAPPAEPGLPDEAREGGPRRASSPHARRVAREAGLDWRALAGTGPGGRVVASDVQAALDAAAGARTGTSAQPPAAGTPGSGRDATRRPDAVTAMRRAVARRTSIAQTIPQFAVGRTLDVSTLRDCRQTLAGRTSAPVTYTDCFLQACLVALARVPQLHASFRDDRPVPHAEPAIGLAVALPQGLVVPLLRPAPGASLLEIAAARAALVERARGGRLTAADLGDPTFVLSNLGGLGVDRFHALLDPAAGAILAVGRVRERPWVRDGALVVAPLCEVSLTVDHRVGDGADAAAFLAAVAAHCESGEGLRIG